MRAQCRLSAAIRNLACAADFQSYFKTKNTHKLQLVKEITRTMGHSYCKILFLFISLTSGASGFIEAQMDLSCLLFGAGLQIFIVMPQMFRFSCEHVENV